MGGSGGGGAQEVNFDSSQLQQELTGLRDTNSPESQAIRGLLTGQVSPEAQVAQRQQLAAIEGGRQGAVQGAREQASARGLFSSDIGIGLEQNAQQNLAGQRANVFGQRAQQIQSGMLSGLQASQNFAGLRSNLANSIAGGQFNADSTNAQLQQQHQQSQQQLGLGLAQTVGGAAGFFFGGPAGGAAGSQLAGGV